MHNPLIKFNEICFSSWLEISVLQQFSYAAVLEPKPDLVDSSSESEQ
jgi:hypothetical protein